MEISVLQLGRLGDMILATPVFSRLKKMFPESNITAICGRHNYQILNNNPFVNNIIIFNKSPLKTIKFIRTLRKIKYFYHIDPKDHYSSEGSFIAKISKAENKIGFNRKDRKVFNYDLRPLEKKFNHEHYTQKILNVLTILGYEHEKHVPKPELFTTKASENYVNEFLKGINQEQPKIVNISASMTHKMLQLEKWDYFFKNNKNENFILSYSPENGSDAEYLLARNSNLHQFRSRNFHDVISLIKNAKLLITPDTSLVHVASSFDVPLLGLYSGRNEFYERFKPTQSVQEILRAEPEDWGIKSINALEIIESYKRLCRKI